MSLFLTLTTSLLQCLPKVIPHSAVLQKWKTSSFMCIFTVSDLYLCLSMCTCLAQLWATMLQILILLSVSFLVLHSCMFSLGAISHDFLCHSMILSQWIARILAYPSVHAGRIIGRHWRTISTSVSLLPVKWTSYHPTGKLYLDLNLSPLARTVDKLKAPLSLGERVICVNRQEIN